VHAGLNFRRGNLYKCLILNRLAAKELTGYDLVLNSNNCLQFLPDEPAWLHYIHFPLAANFEFKMEYGKSPAFRAYSAPAMALLKLVPGSPGPRSLVAGNSEFTADAIAAVENVAREQVEVLYPPVSPPDASPRPDREDLVVSIGTFSSPKRQLEQIAVAARFPDLPFVIIGNSSYDPRYFAACEEAAARCPNVRLLGNAPWSEVEDHLLRARWFLHTTHHEPFGISPVEAMLRGCLPLGHDSGGVRETVPWPELRYRDLDDLTRKLEALRDGAGESRRLEILTHARKFTPEAFRPAFAALIDRVAGLVPA
jgi:glycosyltransferase involved in cell wall biosynthesis